MHQRVITVQEYEELSEVARVVEGNGQVTEHLGGDVKDPGEVHITS